MLSPMLRMKGLLAALLLLSGGAVVSSKKTVTQTTHAEFWRAMEATPKYLRAKDDQHKANFYKNLMAKAKKRPGVRKLDQQEADEFGFDVTKYSLKYVGCAAVEQYSDELADQEEADTVLATKQFVIFRLCPTQYCNKYSVNGCSSDYGEYLIDVEDYLREIAEFNEERMEQICGYCAWCLQSSGYQKNNGQQQDYADNVDAYDYYEAQAQEAYGDDGGYRERDLYGDDQYQEDQYADAANDDGNGQDAYGDQAQDDDGACPYLDECIDYYDMCVSWYQQQAMDYDDFVECVKVDDGDDDGGDEYYIGPHCASDGYTINIGVYSDEWCSTYIGDEVSVEDATGMQFSADDSLVYYSKECVSCLANSETQFWEDWDQDQDENEDNNNNNNYEEEEEEVLEICQALYQSSAKCNQNLYSDDDDAAYGNYASAQQLANEELTCAYMDSLINGNYNENGEVVVDSSLHFPAFNVSDWKNTQQYLDEFSYAKEQSKKISPGLIAGLVISILGCLVLWIWACCLHAQLAQKNMPWRPRRGKYTDPTALSRQNSGIVLGRSRSGTTPLI